MVEFIILEQSLTESEFEAKVVSLLQYTKDGLPTTLSVIPYHLERAAVAIGASNDIKLASLSLFAVSTYTEVAILECAMALENGADEIMLPIDIGSIKEDRLLEARGRIEVVAEEISDSAMLSIYVDSSKFSSFEAMQVAIDVAIESRADSIAINLDSNKIYFLREVADYIFSKNGSSDKVLSLNIVIDGEIDSCDIAAREFINNNNLSSLDGIGALRLSIIL